MITKEKITLGQIQETLLIPLYGRAVESQKPQGMLYDPSAVEMVNSIDYPFEKWDGKPSLAGACLRTLILDQWVKAFLDTHPTGTVIEIGAGLNTRYERLDNGSAQWFELDLPDTMQLRERFFAETDNRHFLRASVTDASWIDAVKASPGPYCFCAEAVLIYLSEAEVQRTFALLHHHFPEAELLCDSMTAWMQKNQQRHDVMKNMEAQFSWSIADPQHIQRWNPHYQLQESLTMLDAFRRYRKHIPLGVYTLYTLAQWVFPPLVKAYRFNRFQWGQERP